MVPEIPEHWQYLKLKFVSKLQGGFAFKSGDFDYEGIPVIRISDVNDVLNEDQCPKYPLKKGQIDDVFKVVNNDILIALTGATIGKTCLVSGLSKLAYLNQRVSKVKHQDPFIYYCLSSKFIQEQIKLKCYGSAQENISNSDIENFYIPYPPATERQTIVDKLNSESAKITRFIQTKQRFIELLKEQRQSIIDEILNPEQEGWSWFRLKNVATINDETIGEETDDNYILKYIDIGNVNSNGQIESLQEMLFKDAPSRARRVVRKGDVIISTVRTYLKAITLISSEDKNLIASTGFAVLRAKPITTSEFLNNVLHTSYFINSVTSNSYGVSYPAITATSLATLKISIPTTIEEQKRIVEHIKTETRTLDIAISKAEREIELIKEYREAMIAEAVTGKMKL